MNKIEEKLTELLQDGIDCVAEGDYNSLAEIKAEIRGIRFAMSHFKDQLNLIKESI